MTFPTFHQWATYVLSGQEGPIAVICAMLVILGAIWPRGSKKKGRRRR